MEVEHILVIVQMTAETVWFVTDSVAVTSQCARQHSVLVAQSSFFLYFSAL